MAQLVAALRRKGLLEVEPDPADGRRRLLVTTEANARYWQGRDQGDHQAVAEWFTALDPDELRDLCALLARLLDGLPAR